MKRATVEKKSQELMENQAAQVVKQAEIVFQQKEKKQLQRGAVNNPVVFWPRFCFGPSRFKIY
jgi:hypothetical protein